MAEEGLFLAGGLDAPCSAVRTTEWAPRAERVAGRQARWETGTRADRHSGRQARGQHS